MGYSHGIALWYVPIDTIELIELNWRFVFHFRLGTMSDDEMRQLGVPALQDDGLIFLWVTGRAMELGRECLKLWGYEVNDSEQLNSSTLKISSDSRPIHVRFLFFSL